MIKVVFVDDDDSVRRATGRLLESEGYDVESFASADQFLSSHSLDRVSCLVLDQRMPGMSGLELQEELIKIKAQIPIVFITGHGDIPMTVKAMKNGAVDFLPKPFKANELLDAVKRAVEKGEKLRKIKTQNNKLDQLLRSLTPSEYRVMRWVITGMPNKQIADKLGITEKTVKVHRGRMMKKLCVTSVADLVRLTQQVQITPAIQ